MSTFNNLDEVVSQLEIDTGSIHQVVHPNALMRRYTDIAEAAGDRPPTAMEVFLLGVSEGYLPCRLHDGALGFFQIDKQPVVGRCG